MESDHSEEKQKDTDDQGDQDNDLEKNSDQSVVNEQHKVSHKWITVIPNRLKKMIKKCSRLTTTMIKEVVIMKRIKINHKMMKMRYKSVIKISSE